jgi:hypothetical protein
VPEIRSGADHHGEKENAMSTPSTAKAPLRRDRDRREPDPVVPTPRRPAEDTPDRARSTREWVSYPGVRYALERLPALRSARPDDPARGDRA